MSKKILTFGNTEIEKNEFYHHKSSIFLKGVDIEKVLQCNKILAKTFGEKTISTFFIGYLYNDHKIKPLHIMLLKIHTYVKRYDGQTKWMYFLIEVDDLLEKYNTIWDKISADIKEEFDIEPVYNKVSLKTKVKSHDVTDSYDKEIPKVNYNYTYLSAISLDSSPRKNENYYLQTLLKECKYMKKIVVRHISDHLSNFCFCNDSYEEQIRIGSF